MIKPIRRIVTGHNARGRSMIASDGPSPHVVTLPGRTDFALTDLWVTDAAPASNAGGADPAKRRMTLEPPGLGTIFRVVEFPPDAAPGGFDARSNVLFHDARSVDELTLHLRIEQAVHHLDFRPEAARELHPFRDRGLVARARVGNRDEDAPDRAHRAALAACGPGR